MYRIAPSILSADFARLGEEVRDVPAAGADWIHFGCRIEQPHFANARSVRNALDRARLRQARRLFADKDRELTPEDLTTIAESDIRASRVFHIATAQNPDK